MRYQAVYCAYANRVRGGVPSIHLVATDDQDGRAGRALCGREPVRDATISAASAPWYRVCAVCRRESGGRP